MCKKRSAVSHSSAESGYGRVRPDRLRPLPSWARPLDRPPPERPKFRAFFFPLPPPVSFFFSLSGWSFPVFFLPLGGRLVSFFLSLVVFSCSFVSHRGSFRGIWWCFRRRGPSNVHVLALGLSCETPAACSRCPTFFWVWAHRSGLHTKSGQNRSSLSRCFKTEPKSAWA